MKVANRLDTHRTIAVPSEAANVLTDLFAGQDALNPHTDSFTIQVDGGSIRMSANAGSVPTSSSGILLADGDVLEHVSRQEAGWMSVVAVSGSPVLQITPCCEEA